MSMKYCSACRRDLEDGAFNKSKSRKDGLQGYCRECHSKAQRKSYEKAVKHAFAPSDVGQKRCTKCGKMKSLTQFHATPLAQDGRRTVCATCSGLRSKSHRLKNKYGITLAERDAMLAAQGGVCAICRRSEHRGLDWNVDHDHKTGKVRAILCMPCNVVLGQADENIQTLQSCIAYLQAHGV